MPTRTIEKRYAFRQGFATDLALQTRDISVLEVADNVLFQVSGAVRKVGGSQRINPTAITGAPDIVGLFDYWKAGPSGNSTQRLVMVGGDGGIYKDTGGTPVSIKGSVTWTTGARPIFAQAGNILTLWSSSADAPVKWNQEGNCAVLGGSPPSARVATYHRSRLWAANTNANPSRLFFSAFGDPETWTGTDSGFIDIDPGDGDNIVGLASYKGALIVFKGPYKGSIHQVVGSAPTGTDAFARKPILKGNALQTHNSIVEVGNDLWFMSESGIYSLDAVFATGDFAQADMTRFLKGFFTSQINRTNLDRVWGVHYSHRSCAIWTLTASGASEHNLALVLSYIRKPEEGLKASLWKRGCLSACVRIHPTTLVREIVFGQTDGFATRQDVATRGLASNTTGGFLLGTDILGSGAVAGAGGAFLGNAFGSTLAYTLRMKTPQIILQDQDVTGRERTDQPVTLTRIHLRSEPMGNYDVTMRISRDGLTPETYTFNQGSAGFLLGTDFLGVGVLGGGTLQTVSADASGEARAVSLEITQGGALQDAHLYEVGIDFTTTAPVGATTL